MFDLGQPHTISKIRLVNYWSDDFRYSFKALDLQVGESIGGKFTTVQAYRGIPHCKDARTYDLFVPSSTTSRFWRIWFTENHGGNCTGIFGIDFWEDRL